MTDQEKSEMMKAFYDIGWNAAIEAAASHLEHKDFAYKVITTEIRKLKK